MARVLLASELGSKLEKPRDVLQRQRHREAARALAQRYAGSNPDRAAAEIAEALTAHVTS